MQEEITKVVTQTQGAPYQDPPGLYERPFEPFEPVLLRAYIASGGWLAFEQDVASEQEYGAQLNACQELLNRGLLSRVDIVKKDGSLNLIGSMVAEEDRTKKKMAELLMQARTNP